MILEAKQITKYFAVERGMFRQAKSRVKALDSVSFCADELKALGIVGESGSGKTTLAKIILKLIAPSSGEISYNSGIIQNLRKDAQIIFQNPYNSLNPKMRILEAVSEPLVIHRLYRGKNAKDRVIELLRMVGLDETALRRRPFEFSGGQRQRICIARALACEPKFIVLDEPVSSLDLTIQARLLDLFIELKARLKLTYVFISHNLGIIKQMSDSVLVMQNGRIVEQGDTRDVFSRPRHPYTKLLLEAAKV